MRANNVDSFEKDVRFFLYGFLYLFGHKVIVELVKKIWVNGFKISKDFLEAVTVYRHEVVAGEEGLSVNIESVGFLV